MRNLPQEKFSLQKYWKGISSAATIFQMYWIVVGFNTASSLNVGSTRNTEWISCFRRLRKAAITRYIISSFFSLWKKNSLWLNFFKLFNVTHFYYFTRKHPRLFEAFNLRDSWIDQPLSVKQTFCSNGNAINGQIMTS